MKMPEELTVPQAATYLNVSEETVRRNIRSKRLKALRRGDAGGSFPAMSSWSSPIATIRRLVRYNRCYRCPVYIPVCPRSANGLRQVN